MRFLGFILFLTAYVNLFAQEHHPLYIVNGVETDYALVKEIPEANIESIDSLVIDEQTIEKYGLKANNGVVLITLKYDKEAVFPGEVSFNDYIASCCQWKSTDPVAQVILRYTIDPTGKVTSGKVLNSTDKRLLMKVQRALQKSPEWEPATKDGKGVESEHVLSITLPKGKKLPREPYIRML